MYILNVLQCAFAWMHIHAAPAAVNVVYVFLFSHLFVSNVNTVMNFPSLCRVWAYCCSAPVCCCSDLEKSGFGYFFFLGGGSVSAVLKTSNRKKKERSSVLDRSFLNLLMQHFGTFRWSSASLQLAAESFMLGC